MAVSVYELKRLVNRASGRGLTEKEREDLRDEIVELLEIAVKHGEVGPTTDSDYRAKLEAIRPRYEIRHHRYERKMNYDDDI